MRRERGVEKKAGKSGADLDRRAGRGATFRGRGEGRVEHHRLAGAERNPGFVDQPPIDVAGDFGV